MTFMPNIHRQNRQSIRMQSWDYSASAIYFVTLVTQGRQPIFGEMVGEDMQLSLLGRLVNAMWQEIPVHFDVAILDEFVVMPNHVHGILAIERAAGAKHLPHRSVPVQGLAANASPLPIGTAPDSLGAVIQNFKSITTRKANQLRDMKGPIWQRNYFERVIRNERELLATQHYIQANEANWAEDVENAVRQPS